MIDDIDRRHFVRGGQQIIHEGLRDQLAVVVIGEFLVERRADAVRDAAHGHAAHDLRIDLRAAVVAKAIAHDLRLAEIGIDADQQQMELEREAGIHLHAPVLVRQHTAGRHLIDVLDREPRLEAVRHAVIVAMRNVDEIGPARASSAARYDHRPCRA